MSEVFGFDFDAGSPQQTAGGNGGGSNYDPAKYEAMDALKKQVLGLGKQTLIGVPSQIYDLGMQERDNYEEEWLGNAEQTTKLEKYEGAHKGVGTNGKSRGKECLIYPQKPVRQITMAVEFFEKMIDLGQFFRKEEDKDKVELKPYRMILGGEWFKKVEGKRVDIVAKPFNMVHTNINRDKKGDHPALWSFAKNNGLYKMAAAAGVLNEDESFTTGDVGKLLGKPMAFEVELEVQSWVTNGETRTKLREHVKLSGLVSARDMAYFNSDIVPLMTEHKALFGGINIHKANNPAHVKTIKKIVRQSMQFASDYKGSVLEGEMTASTGSAPAANTGSSQNVPEQKAAQEPKPQAKAPTQSFNEPSADFDDK